MSEINEIIDGLIFIKDGTKVMSERETINKACDILAKVERGELVEVVRCKECEYSNTKDCRKGTVYCYKHETFYNDDFKCEHGERSVENEDD